MIDNLEGGTISLEHNYAVGPRVLNVSHETLYQGMQDPFERPIWIFVYDFQMANPQDRLELSSRQLRAAEKSREIESFGLLQIVDHGELDDGVPFLISERCTGPSLNEVLERDGTLSEEETAQLVLRLANLIDPLHRKGRHHGSVSEHWIFLPEEEMSDARLGHTHLSLAIHELKKIGSPLDPAIISHLAPEFVDLEEETGSTPHGSIPADIYALGVLAYKCLVGTHPTLAQGVAGEEGLEAIRDQTPTPLSELGVDEQISDVIMRALSTQPSQRWSNAPAMGQALCRAAGLLPYTQDAASDTSGEIALPAEARRASADTDTDTPSSREGGRGNEKGDKGTPYREEAKHGGDEPIVASDQRSTITGLAILALIATNGLWLLWTFSTAPAADSGSANTFSTLQIQSDLPAFSVSDTSAPQSPPSNLGQTPVRFDLPTSDVPLKLELTETQPDDAPESKRIIQLEFLQQTSPPKLNLQITRASSQDPTSPE